eukprot:m51a1_g3705 hypothetical protein (548) ;mRNA; f:425343-427348
MATAVKVIVCGDVRGRLRQLCDHVGALNAKKGPFDLCLCVGDFFGGLSGRLAGAHASSSSSLFATELSDYRNGVRKVPLPTYFIAGAGANDAKELEGMENGGRVCDNLFFLGRYGIKTVSGLRVAFMSGTESARGPFACCTAEAVEELAAVASQRQADGQPAGVDVFLSNQWPAGWQRNVAPASLPRGGAGGPVAGSAAVARAAEALKPRYHFAALENVWYSRPPYRNTGAQGSPRYFTTRFYALGCAFDPQQKARPKPIASIESEAEPADTTDSPWSGAPVQQLAPAAAVAALPEAPAQPWRWSRTGGDSGGPDHKRQRRQQQQQQQQDGRPVGCWFCLSSPQVEAHLVASIGTQCYVAMAKGGLSGHHVVLVPVQHRAACSLLSAEAWDETERYLRALRGALACAGESAVVFERFVASTKTMHAHLQVVPLPEAITEDVVEEAFRAEASKHGASFRELRGAEETLAGAAGEDPYFFVELPSGRRLLASVGPRFPIQFGREVLAGVLGCPERADWHACVVARPQEEAATAQFKSLFAKFDPENPQH